MSELHGLSGQSEKNHPVVPACAIGAHFEEITGETLRRFEASLEGALNQNARLMFKRSLNIIVGRDSAPGD
jgi:hypothetical protein